MCMLHVSANIFIVSFMNSDPSSLCIRFGFPNMQNTCLNRAFPISIAVAFRSGSANTHRENRSITVSIFVYPSFDVLLGVTMSIAIVSHGRVAFDTTPGSPACILRVLFLLAHIRHALIHLSTSAFIFGQ